MHSDHALDAAVSPPARRGAIRRLYDWVLSWADSRHGLPALAAISFAGSAFFPSPPDVLQIALSVARPRSAFLYAAVSAVASVAGGVLGWAIGWGLWHAIADWFFAYVPGFSHEKFSYVEQLYQGNAFAAIFAAAFTPIPYLMIPRPPSSTLVPYTTLVVASALGRSARFFLVAAVMYFCGATAKKFIDRYLEIVTLVLGAAVIAGFVAIKWLL